MLNSLQANEQLCVPSELMKPRNEQDRKPKGVRKTVLCDDFDENEAVI
jgi:hypothetical protein